MVRGIRRALRLRTFVFLAFSSAVAVGCSHSGGGGGGFASSASTQGPSFQSVAVLATPRVEHATVLLASGKLLVIGGRTSATAVTATTELFDPVANTTSGGPALQQARRNHAALVLPTQKVLVIGGESDTKGTALDSTEIFDPKTGQWTYGPKLSEPRSAPAVALYVQAGITKVLIAGGSNAGTASRTADILNVDANTLAGAPTNLLEACAGGSALTLAGGTTILVQGGWKSLGASPVPASSETFDTASGIFMATPSLVARAESTLVAIGSSAYALGGTNGTQTLNSAESFNGKTWSASSNLSAARRGHTATVLASGVLVAGGAASVGTGAAALGSTELWSASGSKSAPALAKARLHHTATALPNGEVVLVGGEDGTTILSSIEVYTTSATPTPTGSGTAPVPSSAAPGQNGQGNNGKPPLTTPPVAPAPGVNLTIEQIAPGQGLPGHNVEIDGLGFDPVAANDIVTFGGVVAPVGVAQIDPDHGRLAVAVPASLKPGTVMVTVTVAGKTSNAVPFVVR